MCENNKHDDIDKIFCDNMADLARELETPSKKQAILQIIQFILITVTIATILTFYQYPEINYWVKWASTITLCVLCNVVSHRLGLESGSEMGRKVAKAKEKFNERMVERMVRMIKERTKNEGED